MAKLSEITLETFKVSFTSQTSKNVTFTKTYNAIPTAVVTPSGNINSFITNLTTTGCTVSTSDTFTGTVMLNIIGR